MALISPLSPNLLRLSEDKQQLLLLISDIDETVTLEGIINLVKNSDFANFKFNKEGLKKATHCFNNYQNNLSGDFKFQSIVIAERSNAKLQITMNPQKTSAKAMITSSFGGRAISYQQVIEEIKTQDICVGISEIAIKQLVTKSIEAKPGTTYQITIAKGTEAVNGRDSYFQCLLEHQPKALLTKSINMQYGSVDMSNISSLLSVKKGQQLMRRHPAVQGHDGLTVTGEIIKHHPAHDYPFVVGNNTAISNADKNILLATSNGLPIIFDKGMAIDAILKVDSLNADSAQINHKGSLIVVGDICGCAEIVATGDITVIGFIDSSKVECGGDLFVSKGILGHRTKPNSNEFSSNINCRGSLFANFIQYATVNVGQDLNIKYQILHSNVHSNGYVNVKDEEGKKGAIFGGVISANKGICTVTLGAQAGIKTTIELNGSYSDLSNYKNRIEQDTNLIKQKLQAALNAQKKLSNISDCEKKQLLDERLMLTIKDTKKKLLKLNNERHNNYIERQQYFNSTNVLVLKELHSEVSIAIGDNKFRSAHNYGASKICIKNELLTVSPYYFTAQKAHSYQAIKV